MDFIVAPPKEKGTLTLRVGKNKPRSQSASSQMIEHNSKNCREAHLALHATDLFHGLHDFDQIVLCGHDLFPS